MALITCSFKEFVRHVRQDKKKIICYGAGMMPYYIEQILIQYGLLQYIELFVDGNPAKWGKTVSYRDTDIEICAPDVLKSCDRERQVILITAEKYFSVLDALSGYVNTQEWECYAYPILNVSLFQAVWQEQAEVFERDIFSGTDRCAEADGIPKVIHYTWFGGGEKPELVKACLKSWQIYCPDYEIVEWNESNYDVQKNLYCRQAYERKKWAYVSDYARMDILYRHGGIYFDTDVELTGHIDFLLSNNAFLCYGEWPAPNSGAGAGCVKNHALMKAIMKTREQQPFLQPDGTDDPRTNSNYEMDVLCNYGFRMNFEYQMIDRVALYPPDFIAPVSITGADSFRTKRTVGIHHCDNSWRGSERESK